MRSLPGIVLDIILHVALVCLLIALATAKSFCRSPWRCLSTLYGHWRDRGIPPDEPPFREKGCTEITSSSLISIIIPAYNEESTLEATVVAAKAGDSNIEILVVDGGSLDGTVELARSLGLTVLTCSDGTRAGAMNQGASSATGDIFMFLHSDSILPPDYGNLVRRELCQPSVLITAFRFAVADALPGIWLVAAGTNLRAKYLQMPYGDQTLTMRKSAFLSLGGYATVQLMEDFLLVKKAKSVGLVTILPAETVTSARRWAAKGVLTTTVTNWLCIIGYHAGISTERIRAWYY